MGVLDNHGIGEGVAVGTQGTDTFREGLIHDQIALLGKVFHAAVDVTALKDGLCDCFAVNGEVKIDWFFQGYMNGAKGKFE